VSNEEQIFMDNANRLLSKVNASSALAIEINQASKEMLQGMFDIIVANNKKIKELELAQKKEQSL
jgi:hypothetical protein